MAIRLIGAGLGRTGTHSLKLALEELLGGTCHHMMEVFGHPAEVPVWHAAMEGSSPDWPSFLAGYTAIVDFPGAAVWRELADALPDVPVLLSTRSSSEAWWQSASQTILAVGRRPPQDDHQRALRAMADAMFHRFSPDGLGHEAVVAAYDAHNAAVRAAFTADRLFEYQPGDGWGPLCAALDLPEPESPFPHTNTTADFRAAAGLDR